MNDQEFFEKKDTVDADTREIEEKYTTLKRDYANLKVQA